MKLASMVSVSALIAIIAASPEALAGVVLIVAAAFSSASYLRVTAARTPVRESRKRLISAQHSPLIRWFTVKAAGRCR